MFRTFLLIGIGGMIGSILRYSVYLLMLRGSIFPLPWGTFAVNVTGSFLIGLIIGWTDKAGIGSQEWRLFLATGLCGGFTTFSALSLESVNMLKAGNLSWAFLYITGSVLFGIGATFLGLMFSR
jgi:CrcB protein